MCTASICIHLTLLTKPCFRIIKVKDWYLADTFLQSDIQAICSDRPFAKQCYGGVMCRTHTYDSDTEINERSGNFT